MSPQKYQDKKRQSVRSIATGQLEYFHQLFVMRRLLLELLIEEQNFKCQFNCKDDFERAIDTYGE